MKKSNKQVPQQKHLIFLPSKKVCSFSGQPSILEVAIANDIPLGHSCGGMGSCTTCRIFVVEGSHKLEPRNEVEQEHAQMRGYAPHERLSCQTTALDGLVCEIPQETTDVRLEGDVS